MDREAPIDPSDEQLELLEEALDDVLDGDLGGLAADVGLGRERLTAEAREDAGRILAGAESAWVGLERARRQERELRMGSEPWWQRLMRRVYAGVRRVDLPPATAGLVFIAAGLVLAVGFAFFVVLLLAEVSFPSGPGWLRALFWSGALLGFVWVLARFRVGPDREDLALLAEQVTSGLAIFKRRLREAGVLPWLRRRINLVEGRSYATHLAYKDCSGLAEVDDPNTEIPTVAKQEVSRLIELMPGGAIGLSGTRGVGKSTLMRSVCSEQEGGKRPVLATIVDAPVEYDAREFVLHLFAKVCARVLGPTRVAALRNWDRPVDFSTQAARPGRLGYPPLAGPALIVAGAVIALAEVARGSFLLSPIALGVGLVALGYYLTRLSWGRDRIRLRSLLRALRARPRAKEDGDPNDPLTTAATRLRQIWFQQSFSSGWSGTLELPVGASAGVSATTELSEQQLSFPDIVTLLKEFLEQVSNTREIRIGIDELDKMDDETARRFLNEIKVVFRVPKCFFFISISEDAMSFFERRGLPFRDVFDSSFDDVVQLSHLDFEDSKELLDRRIVDLPLPFICLLHCLSGGLPRDLIRAARDLVVLPEGTSLEQAATELLGDALRAKAMASRIAARRFESEEHATLLVLLLEDLDVAGCHPDALLDVCRGFEERFLAPIRRLDDEDLRAERRALQGLGTQVVAFAYYAATLLQLFATFDRPENVDRARGADSEGPEVASPIDRLAAVYEAFSADLNSAWEMLSGLRRNLGFEPVVDFPRLQPQALAGAPEGAPAAGK